MYDPVFELVNQLLAILHLAFDNCTRAKDGCEQTIEDATMGRYTMSQINRTLAQIQRAQGCAKDLDDALDKFPAAVKYGQPSAN